MTSTTGAPVFIDRPGTVFVVPPHPILVIHYEPFIALILLDYWAEYRLTMRKVRVAVMEGGSIDKIELVTEGGYCIGAEEYVDLLDVVNTLPPQERAAVSFYWGLGWRSVKRIGKRLHHAEDYARALVWGGAQLTLERLCGLDPMAAKIELRIYREKLHSHHIRRP